MAEQQQWHRNPDWNEDRRQPERDEARAEETRDVDSNDRTKGRDVPPPNPERDRNDPWLGGG
jgi:hypothetical protein